MEPQKVPLILLTDRPVQLETPRHYFRSDFTPSEAFYVRWHLDGIPNAIDCNFHDPFTPQLSVELELASSFLGQSELNFLFESK